MANSDAIMRSEFQSTMERLGSRMAALEAVATQTVQIDAEGRATATGQFEVVTQSEFRLFKWLAAFVAAAVLGAFGVLYQQIADMRVEMRDLHATVLSELYAQIGGVRADLGKEIDGVREDLRKEIDGVREDLRKEMKANHDSVIEAIGSLRERVVRVETLLDVEEAGAQS